MIKGGYYLRAKRIDQSPISKAPPYMREIWDYLLRKANFTTCSNLKPGQLYRSYQKIIDDLAWYVGARKEKYSKDQIKKAMAYMRRHGMIVTDRQPRAVLITICNYSYYQNWRNYGSTDEGTVSSCENFSEINRLDPLGISGSPNESAENACESTTGGTGDVTAVIVPERTLADGADACTVGCLEHSQGYESTAGCDPKALVEAPREPAPLNNIHQYREIIGSTSIGEGAMICPPVALEDECDFDRDRRIFFDAFSGLKTIQTFDDKKDRGDQSLIRVTHFENEIPLEYQAQLERLNERGAGIYMGVNETDGKGRKTLNVVRVRAVFGDFDSAPIEPVWEYAPSLVIKSSPGKYHVYWLTANEIPLDCFRQLQERIISRFQSDRRVKDLPRVMRIPGFENRKADPYMINIIHYSGVRYTYAQLMEMFPPSLGNPMSTKKYRTKVNSYNKAGFRGGYGAVQGGRNNHVTSRIGGMIRKGMIWSEIESEAYKEGAACSPPLSINEVQSILKSTRRYV